MPVANLCGTEVKFFPAKRTVCSVTFLFEKKPFTVHGNRKCYGYEAKSTKLSHARHGGRWSHHALLTDIIVRKDMNIMNIIVIKDVSRALKSSRAS